MEQEMCKCLKEIKQARSFCGIGLLYRLCVPALLYPARQGMLVAFHNSKSLRGWERADDQTLTDKEHFHCCFVMGNIASPNCS